MVEANPNPVPTPDLELRSFKGREIIISSRTISRKRTQPRAGGGDDEEAEVWVIFPIHLRIAYACEAISSPLAKRGQTHTPTARCPFEGAVLLRLPWLLIGVLCGH